MESKWFCFTIVTILLFQLSAGEDNECTAACPHILDPVCATDGRKFKYFSNRCLLDGHNKCEPNNRFREVDETNCDDDDWQK
uniref:Kazal-like domain-containing protein n=1 Tax=Anopheles minimus TaxID=112268 RepID=A0A182WNW2_9DIPT